MYQLQKSIVILFISFVFAYSQSLNWIEQHNDELPEGVILYKAVRSDPRLQAFYLDVDLNRSDLALRPYKFDSNGKVPDLSASVGAYASINGGFFGGTTSYSSVIYPGEIKAINVKSLTRNDKSYPVIRSLFGIDTTGQMSVNWIYHFDNTLDGLYRFDEPMNYTNNDPDPLPEPEKADGTPFAEILVGIGGGPTLVRDSVKQVTYDEEIFWGSGVGYDNRDPRTAVGFTSDGHAIFFVADGRQTISQGVSLPELADIFLELGCVAAMNLDGGGSTGMAIGDTYINSPSEQRSVPTILSVVHYDSLGLPREPLFEKVIDTGDSSHCSVIGSWFETANEGYWGDTKAILNDIGDGSEYVEFRPRLGTAAEYELYAWWVSSSDQFRSTNVPVIIHHKNGIDTVKIDQTKNGSTWNLLGKYTFAGDSADKIIISDEAEDGPYVMADAIRLVAYDTSSATAISVSERKPRQFILLINYPNPFNPVTTIKYTIGLTDAGGVETQHIASLQKNDLQQVDLSVFNVLGQKIATLVSSTQRPGEYEVRWDASALSSGVYFCKLEVTGGKVGEMAIRKMLLLR
jgi:hypothetical protein